jgi:DNA processing protein
LLALQRLPRVGAQRALRIALGGIAPQGAHAEQWQHGLNTAERDIAEWERAGTSVVSFFDRRYPERLRAIQDPPMLLFVRGNVELLSERRSVAVVGTREPSRFGVTATERLTSALADAAWAIISGLANGIDALAHGAALKNHAATLAVLGGGVEKVYPAAHRELALAIVDQGGAMVSEQPPGTPPLPRHLVARNRIQTGLAVAVVATQTGKKGGTMHTIRHAAAQGRPVFCPVPNESHEKSAGLSLLLSRPANELCDVLPAWRDAKTLCARLGPNPLARPVKRTDMDGFLNALELALEEPQTTPATRWWPPTASQAKEEHVPEPAPIFALPD